MLNVQPLNRLVSMPETIENISSKHVRKLPVLTCQQAALLEEALPSVLAYQGRNRKYLLLIQLHISKGQVTLLHSLSSPHPSVHTSFSPSSAQA